MSRSLLVKVSYASASLTAALLNQFYQAKAQFFYVVELKLPPTYYALAIGIWAIWNSINDPLAGFIMDRRQTRWGRRLPWMIGFWIPLVLSFGLIWSPPSSLIGNTGMLFLWLVIVLVLYDTGYTIVILAWAALFPEIFTSQEDRNLVAGLRQVFSLFALILALVVPPFFITEGNLRSYAIFGWVLAGISFLNLGFAFYGSREPKYARDFFTDSYSLSDVVDILKNKTFQAFLVGNLITFFAYGQVLAMLPFYRKFILHQDYSFEALAYTGALGLTFLSLKFWVWLTTRSDARLTYLFSAAFFAITLLPVWFIDNSVAAIINISLVGFGLAGQLMVVDLLLAQVIDQDYLECGTRREGIFFGINGFFIRLAILLQSISLAVVSEWTGFNEHANVQTEFAQTGIKIQFILLPIIGFLLGIGIVYHYYDLHGEKLADQNEAIKILMEKNRDSGYIDPVK